MNNGADNAMASATLAEIANGGGNGSITMEQLLAALTQVVGKQQSNDKRVVMKNKETQTTTREERWDKPVAKSKVDGNDRATAVRNYRAKKEVVSGTKKAISGNNNDCDGNKHPVGKKTAGKQKTPPSKKATEEEKGDDNSRGKEADGAVNGEPERCGLVRGTSLAPFLVSCLLANHYVTIRSFRHG